MKESRTVTTLGHHSLIELSGCDAEKLKRVAGVRRAMLDALGPQGAELNPRLKHRLMYLSDANALWYARSEMVNVLSRLHGEARAVETVIRLTPVFQGLVPKSLMDACRLRR